MAGDSYSCDRKTYIISLNLNENRCECTSRAAVLLYLYYEEDFSFYMNYISFVPEYIDVYICSSQKEIINRINQDNRIKAKTILKNNRGRDLSAFLVAFKKYFYKYDLLCFLHDKKAHYSYLEQDVECWKQNLCDSMLGGISYISNIISLFEENEALGMLVPPEPCGDYLPHWYSDTWCDDFDNTLKLANEMNLSILPNKDEPVRSLSSVFWARTKAIRKIVDMNWEYDDFPEEPMPIDGTVSHAIERIFEYVVRDANYLVAVVMTDEMAVKFYEFAQTNMRMMFNYLSKSEGVFDLHQIRHLVERDKMIYDFCMKNDDVYIYGAGQYGRTLLEHLRNKSISPKGFLVTQTTRMHQSEIEGLKVEEVDNVIKCEKLGILIAVSYETRQEIESILQSYSFTNYIYAF